MEFNVRFLKHISSIIAPSGYEKEVIDYETLGSICNDLGYDFSNSKIKVVKDFEPFQDTIDDLGICTFNQNKEKKIKTIFWAMNTLYKYQKGGMIKI